MHSQAFHFWDGPGRRGSSTAKSRATSVGAGGGGRGKTRTGSGSSFKEGVAALRGESRVRGMVEQALLADEEDQGVGGGFGVFGNAVSDGEQEEDEEGDDDEQNFYENYAEDTKGKRKTDMIL